ncbi:MAG: polysaccharide biosynthesis/export family protein [Planctomycetales bacterium]|nr:polysaccharide biosynthesis/export family protein [Planctomycetales bacterium]
MTDARPRWQMSLQTMFLLVFTFALGFVTRNLASGLHPFVMKLVLPSSITPIAPGDELIVESVTDETVKYRVAVLSDGTIRLPHVGTVSVSGQDIDSVQNTLEKAYAKFLAAPGIQVCRADAFQSLQVTE